MWRPDVVSRPPDVLVDEILNVGAERSIAEPLAAFLGNNVHLERQADGDFVS